MILKKKKKLKTTTSQETDVGKPDKRKDRWRTGSKEL